VREELRGLAESVRGLAGRREVCVRLREALAPLVAYDARTGADLVPTLRAYVESGSIAETAERLFLHRNSVAYRLQRIQALSGIDPRDRATRLVLLVAFALTGPSVLSATTQEENDHED